MQALIHDILCALAFAIVAFVPFAIYFWRM